jgi:hypothetical protein
MEDSESSGGNKAQAEAEESMKCTPSSASSLEAEDPLDQHASHQVKASSTSSSLPLESSGVSFVLHVLSPANQTPDKITWRPDTDHVRILFCSVLPLDGEIMILYHLRSSFFLSSFFFEKIRETLFLIKCILS